MCNCKINDHCLQGLLPVKWMAIESLADRTYTHKSDVYVFQQSVLNNQSLRLYSLLFIMYFLLPIYCNFRTEHVQHLLICLILRWSFGIFLWELFTLGKSKTVLLERFGLLLMILSCPAGVPLDKACERLGKKLLKSVLGSVLRLKLTINIILLTSVRYSPSNIFDDMLTQ